MNLEEKNIEELKRKWNIPSWKSSKTKKQRDSYKINIYPEFHTQYQRRKKELGQTDNIITRKQFSMLISKLLELIAYKILNEGYIFHIPYGCGAIRVNKTKHKVRAKNFNDNLAVKAWDYTYRFVWDKTLAHFKDMDLRIFYPSKKLKTLKRQKILKANVDPMTKDLIGYAFNQERIIQTLPTFFENRNKTKRLKRLGDLEADST